MSWHIVDSSFGIVSACLLLLLVLLALFLHVGVRLRVDISCCRVLEVGVCGGDMAASGQYWGLHD